MIYTVKYKQVGAFFWKTIKKVKGDHVANDLPTRPRVLILDDESRIEIPTTNMMWEFSHERFILIKKQMESEAGQTIPTKTLS